MSRAALTVEESSALATYQPIKKWNGLHNSQSEKQTYLLYLGKI